MNRSHKIRLCPTAAQEVYFRRACGCARQAYNWAVARTKEMLDAKQKPTDKALKAEFNTIKREQFPWQLEVTKCAAEGALRNFAAARQKFFKNGFGFPTFHKKGYRDSFYISNDAFELCGKFVKIPKLGRVKMREALRFSGKIMSGTVSCQAGRWFISVAVELPDPTPPAREKQAVGVDLGVKTAATLSTGEKFEGPKALSKALGKLRRLNKAVSRKVLGSQNRKKAVRRLANCHYKISCVRNDFLHKLTTGLVRRFTNIGIEDLNVAGMLKNHRLARGLSDQAFSEFRRQLSYKAAAAGTDIHVADRFYPSSKRCSVCGAVFKNLKLSMRAWTCATCSTCHDRDLNAAGNLKEVAVDLAASACGVRGKCTGVEAGIFERTFTYA